MPGSQMKNRKGLRMDDPKGQPVTQHQGSGPRPKPMTEHKHEGAQKWLKK